MARIGVGGMGEVLLARRKGAAGFEKLIAIKTIRSDLVEHDQMRRMFLDEARLLARLDHPAIAQVYDLDEADGVLYLSMEYVPGIALGTLMKRKKVPIPAGVALQIVAEAARGLHAAHELEDLDGKPLGVIHRDISPQNLILTFDGRIKVLDFGVAFMRGREAATTDAGMVKGKLAYLSPEQINNKPIDRRADIYSLSVVAHELLTARRLFGKGESLADALRRGRIAKPSSLNKDVPSEVDALVMKGLAKDPDDRWQDAREMALALEVYVRGSATETLEAFTLRELSTERDIHKSWIQKIVSAPDADTQSGIGATHSVSPIELLDVVTETPRPPPNTGPWAFLLLLIAVAAGAAVITWKPEWIDVLKTQVAALMPTDTSPDASIEGGISEAPIIEPVASGTGTAAVAATSTLAETLTSALEEDDDESEPSDETPPIPIPTSTPAVVSTPPTHEPTPAPRPPQPKKVQAPRPPPKVASKAVAKRPAKPGYGALTISARPGGSIYVDGRRVGGTPLAKLRVPAGRHMVALKRPGDPRPRWQSTVNIHEGKHVRVTLR